MGLFDNIAKKAKETAAAASKAYVDASKSIKEKTIGELVDSAIDAGSKAMSHLSESGSSKAEYQKKNYNGGEPKKTRQLASKDMSCGRQKNEKKENVNKEVRRATDKSNHHDYLDDALEGVANIVDTIGSIFD